jgi:adenylate cyclase
MEERAKRKLTAILSADVKGYSRLMQEDELVTIRTLETYREMIAEVIRNYSGRVVDSPGDNVLAEFVSVVDAVESAVEIQENLKVKNAELPENRKMEFRIGINLGDVVEEGERIYGDGVNIAARIEGLAEGGGICISRTAFGQVKNKLNLGYAYLGEHSVKNIAEPVQVYRVLMDPEAAGKVIGERRPISRRWRWAAVALIVVAGVLAIWNFYFRPPLEPASTKRTTVSMPDRPSVAVLAFDNLTGDPNQEYFSDGIAEEIITALSKTPRLLVIARQSSFSYKGKPVKVQQVAEELGVRYVVEGSVRKAADQVRITAQLVDAHTGRHIWGKSYDLVMENIFAVQDEIAMKIITALRVQLTDGEQALVIERGTTNLKAYLKVLEVFKHARHLNPTDNLKARRAAEEAIALDPNYPMAYLLLGETHINEVWLGSTKSPGNSLRNGAELAQKALSMDASLGHAHYLFAQIYILQREFEKGIAEARRAVELEPNGAHAHWFLGSALTFAGRPEEAIPVGKKAISLNPYSPSTYFRTVAKAYRNMGQYDEAISYAKKAVERSPGNQLSRSILITCYTLAGSDEEARAQVKELLEIHPEFCVTGHPGFYKDPAIGKRVNETLAAFVLHKVMPA